MLKNIHLKSTCYNMAYIDDSYIGLNGAYSQQLYLQ